MVDGPSISSRALQNCRVTCTGFQEDEIADIAAKVRQASGVYQPELDNRVTHLIAASAGGRKYRAVCGSELRKRVHVVKRSWLAECCGYAGDIPPDPKPHAMRCLEGFVVASTGFKGGDLRRIVGFVRRCGALYTKNLDTKNTHLVAKAMVGEKVRLALRKRIQIVSFDWLRCCWETNLLQEEERFSVAAMPGAGEGATPTGSLERNHEASGGTLANPKSVVEDLANITPSLALEACCIYLVPVLSGSSDAVRLKHTRLMRLAALSGAMVAPRWSPFVTHAVVMSVPVAHAQVIEMRNAEVRGVVVVDADWVWQSAKQATCLPCDDFAPPPWSTLPAANGSSGGPSHLPALRENAVRFANDMSNHSAMSSIFRGVRLALGPLALCMPELCADLSARVVAGRGKILQHDSTGRVLSGIPTHILCPPSLSQGELGLVAAMRANGPQVDLVTPIWIEECISAQKLLAASTCILFSAREYCLPLRGFRDKRIVLTISGMMSVVPNPNWNRRRNVIITLAKALGATYSDLLKRNRTTHLIVESMTKEQSEKMRSAFDWGIPIVSEEWLLACARVGTLVAIDPYLVASPTAGSGAAAVARRASKLVDGTSHISPEPLASSEHPTSPRTRKRRSAASGRQDRAGLREQPRRKSPRNVPPSSELLTEALSRVGDKLVQEAKRGGGDSRDGEDSKIAGIGSRGQPRPSSEPAGPGLEGDRRFLVGRGGQLDGKADVGDGVSGDVQDLDLLRASGTDLGVGSINAGGKGIVDPRRSEWSLEASQSQLIVHRDLTPPPVPFVEQKMNPRIRTMPSRAAKSTTS